MKTTHRLVMRHQKARQLQSTDAFVPNVDQTRFAHGSSGAASPSSPHCRNTACRASAAETRDPRVTRCQRFVDIPQLHTPRKERETDTVGGKGARLALCRGQGEEPEDEQEDGDESWSGITSHGGRRGARWPQAGVDLCAQEKVEGLWEEHSIGLLLLPPSTC